MNFFRFAVRSAVWLVMGPLLLICAALSGCGKPADSPPIEPKEESVKADRLSAAEIEELRPRVKAFCGACHEYPEPETFPRSVWRKEVHNGFNFFVESGRTDLDPPGLEEVMQYYTQQAPEVLALPAVRPVEESSKVRWESERILPTPGLVSGSISSLEKFRDEEGWKVVATEMASGTVRLISFADGRPAQKTIARLNHPAKATPADFDGDGVIDFLVAELGSAKPADHQNGKVIWLRGDGQGNWHPQTLFENTGRIADVQAADFTGDGRNDLLVAEFGWRKSGGIHLLVQQPLSGEFEHRQLDDRHGTIHLPVVDWNGDGHRDFVALISQEHEVIVLFLNQGDGRFQPRTLYAAPEPAFGSSGIELVDFDGDGDQDVLYTSGDTMDSFQLKPSHGVRWLENTGTLPMTAHLIGPLAGCYRALAADLDGDGDLDVAASAQFPANIENLKTERETLVWFERTGDSFEQRTLAVGGRDQGHFAFCLGEFTGAGGPEILTGDHGKVQSESDLRLWRTQ